MSQPIRFIPPRVLLVTPDGMISREWYLFFQSVFDRIGGSTGSSTNDLSLSLFEDAGTSETNSSIFQAVQDTAQTAAFVPQEQFDATTLLNTLNALREQVAVLTTAVQDLSQYPNR